MKDSPDNIRYLTYHQIDKSKWDECIHKAKNGLIYGYSFYLDHMSENWDGLILNDYEAVMPLTWKRKYGIHYLYQPFLTAQLGVFGNTITRSLVSEFIRKIPEKFKLVEICLNHENNSDNPSQFTYYRKNYILDLNKPYDLLKGNYRQHVLRNIKKAFQLGCYLEKNIDPGQIIELAVQQMRAVDKTDQDGFFRFRKLYKYLEEKNVATTYGIYSRQQQLIASCIFFFSHNRAYYILVGNHPNGKTLGASHALIDAFIRDHADSPLILDFEGSDINSLEFFYSSFGAINEPYPFLKINQLPFFAKWFKK